MESNPLRGLFGVSSPRSVEKRVAPQPTEPTKNENVYFETQAGPPGLHCWRNSRGLGCYQGDPNGACLWPLALHD